MRRTGRASCCPRPSCRQASWSPPRPCHPRGSGCADSHAPDCLGVAPATLLTHISTQLMIHCTARFIFDSCNCLPMVQAADLKVSIRGSAMVRPEVQEREDGALQVRCTRTGRIDAAARFRRLKHPASIAFQPSWPRQAFHVCLLQSPVHHDLTPPHALPVAPDATHPGAIPAAWLGVDVLCCGVSPESATAFCRSRTSRP